jgi:type VI secretion system protein ImpF
MSTAVMSQPVIVAELQRRYPPTLFDRLIDGRATGPVRHAGDGGRQALKEAVLRDLTWLLNSTHAHRADPLHGFAHILTSVLNFGMPALEHVALLPDATRILETAVHEAITRFEPRLARHSLDVRCRFATTPGGQPCLTLNIDADLLTHPVASRIELIADFVTAGEPLVLRSRGAA